MATPNPGAHITLDTYTYERRKAHLDAALRDAETRGDWNLHEDVSDELIELEKELIKLNTDEQEDAACAQLKILKEVLKELREKSGILYENPQKYYWLIQGDYIKMGSYRGILEVWSSGCRGDRDDRKCDWEYEIMTDLNKWRNFIRLEALPLFNQLRANKRAALERGIKDSITQLNNLQGDID